jgi:hypothetical protein
MKLSTNTILIVFGILALGILALIPIGMVAARVLAPQPQPTVDTQATLQAMVTQTIVALTQTAPTQTPIPPTPIIIQVTSTPAPTFTPTSTATPVSYCDWAYFIKDVTVPDGSFVDPGETFIKTWRLKNRGTCTWTPDYMLVFSSGTQMGGTTALRLPGYVAPGQTVDISVTLTAPTTPDHYTGFWMLRNPSGTLFGSGDNANKAIYVDIRVRKQPDNLPHGTVAGTIYYPSEFNPPLILYFQRVGSNEVIQFSIAENQNEFSVLLPNGTYYAYAWAPNYNLEGAYVNADKTMKQFTVTGGGSFYIEITDWGITHHLPGQ